MKRWSSCGEVLGSGDRQIDNVTTGWQLVEVTTAGEPGLPMKIGDGGWEGPV